ncbi:MAG: sugar transferase [Acidobacteria bacterium]|nr:sugar transferase [Acidobacteriota bacterium]
MLAQLLCRRHRANALMKRMMDIAVCLAALPLAGPLLLLAALAVKLTSPGPVLFTQWRLGRDGVRFRLLKLRSMAVDAPDLRNPDGSAFSGDRDPRVTPVGRFLRRTSLDELPQLLNVLRGEMSLVGPRPDQVDQLRFYTPAERRKLLVQPGLTGLAQIGGRNTISWTERKALDVEYVDRQSFRLDCAILWRTIPCVLFGKNLNTSSCEP